MSFMSTNRYGETTLASDARTGALSSIQVTLSGTPGTVTTITASAFAVGDVAKADLWEVRILEDGTSRTLRLLSASASVVVELSTF